VRAPQAIGVPPGGGLGPRSVALHVLTAPTPDGCIGGLLGHADVPARHFHLDDSSIVESESDTRSRLPMYIVHRQDNCLQTHSPSFQVATYYAAGECDLKYPADLA
jgi:hypothetical protein